ncbi:MAG TPA: selenocysteine-specific translation elongation factor [Blastocatellia bacterium]|nr:selenocysteine-specific translation elongation factor [Blastocatellia bacterium]
MKHVIIGTAGHIDHGKTALVKALTGTDTDRLKEEKQRGITIDIGFAELTVGDVRFGFVDVPGHERFVKNMLAGVHGIDCVILVVAADESIMPQTREHFDICRLLNVKSGLVALTKSDIADDDLLELARAEVEEFIRGSFLEGAAIIPVSSRSGSGIDAVKQALVDAAARIEPKVTDAPPRLPMDRAFSVKGFGTVVTGTLIAGELATGDEVEVLPAGHRSRVRNLQVHGMDTDRAFAGQRTAVNLQGLTLEQVQRGSVVTPAGRLQVTMMLDARLILLGSAPKAVSNRSRVRVHLGTAEVMARVVVLGGQSSDDTDRRSVEPGTDCLVQLRLEAPVTALPGDRFIIRSYSPQITIGGGIVLDALPVKHRSSERHIAANLVKLESAAPAERASIFIEMAGVRGMNAAELAARTGATDGQLARIVRELLASGRVLDVGGSPQTLLSRTAYTALAARVVELLRDHHEREPLSLGVSKEEVRERVFGAIRPEVFRAVTAALCEERKLVAERDSLRLASHQPSLSDGESVAKGKLEAAFKAASLQAPTLDDAASEAGVPIALARKLLNLLFAEQRVLKIGDMIFHLDSINELKNKIRARKAISSRIDVAAFKEITGGLTRKYAIPLLEYLDRERITRRVGNEREII